MLSGTNPGASVKLRGVVMGSVPDVGEVTGNANREDFQPQMNGMNADGCDGPG
jgi:hypothetical protein